MAVEEVAEQPGQASDRRRAPRRKVLLRGKLVWDGLTQPIDCTIRDISNSGAGIRLFENQDVPDRVFLVVMRDRIAQEAEVRWHSRSNLGLHFLRCFSLDDPSPPEFAIPKQLWEHRELYCDADDIRTFSLVTVYNGFRLTVVPVDGGFAAYAKKLEDPADSGTNPGERVSDKAYASAVGALRAAKTAVDTGSV